MRVTGSGLIIPSSVASVKAPKFSCTLCGSRFYDHELSIYERHVAGCSEGLEPDTEGPFSEDAFDSEYEEWVREHGRVK